MLHLIPARLHRALLPLAHRLRRRWRQIAKPKLRGVSVIVRDSEGRVLLLRHSYGRALWSLPGGGLSKNEDAAQGALREVREELGVELSDFEALGELEEIISGAPHHAYIFSGLCRDEPRPDQREVIEARFFTLDALPDDVSTLTLSRLALLERG